MGITQFLMFYAWKYLSWRYDVSQYFASNVLVVGPEDFFTGINERFAKYRHLGYKVEHWKYDKNTGLLPKSKLHNYNN